MRLEGTVEISNGSPMCYNFPKDRARQATLTLTKSVGVKDECCIVHQTAQNRFGDVYKIKDNIEKVCLKYINEGKSTIRFKHPPHDMIINGPVPALKKFLKLLKLCLNNDTNKATLPLSNVLPRVPEGSTVDLEIMTSQEFSLTGPPNTFSILQLKNLELSKFDPRILCMENLRRLDLSSNCLTTIPKDINLLSKLDTLILSKNQLGKGNVTDWEWIMGNSLRKTLAYLDLSENEINFIPNQVARMNGLVTLNLQRNLLKRLPPGLGNLDQLRYCNISTNLLECLPCTAAMLRLSSIDVSGNPFKFTKGLHSQDGLGVPSLLDLAGRAVVNNRIEYKKEDLPTIVWNLLDSAQYCRCGSACFNMKSRILYMLDLSTISEFITRWLRTSSSVPVEAFLCSSKCYYYSSHRHRRHRAQ